MQLISLDVHREKYAKGPEKDVSGPEAIRLNQQRVARALSAVEKDPAHWESMFMFALGTGFIPAGRIWSAAGTHLEATLMNCYVLPVGDSSVGPDDRGLPGVYQVVTQAIETQKRGGGVGYNFSNIRPRGALVRSSMSTASGPVAHMRVFDQACETVNSAGNRQGAQMAVLDINHPDIFEFVEAKQQKGVLTKFNLSVAVPDSFMEALQAGQPYDLVHRAEPSPEQKANGAYQREDGLWVYRTIDPQTLWDRIMRNAYDTGEPGILFPQRINRENNLFYCETLSAVNPCAEQPLPPYGACCLGSMNLAYFISAPFTPQAQFNLELFGYVVRIAQRMLDNVLDITSWPLPEQRDEGLSKRRIGLGITGLGNALTMLGLRYDSEAARQFAAQVCQTLCHEAYRGSIEVAKEKGPFPLFDRRYLQSEFVARLPEDIRQEIAHHGIRNSHLISIAPAGTISLVYGQNCSSGIEPSFSWKYQRKRRLANGEFEEFAVEDYAYRLYRDLTGHDDPKTLPESFVSALDISASDHLRMLKAIQPYVDSSISKTVNIPVNYPFEDFRNLYLEAYRAGLKGLATFRPNPITGSVLSTDSSQDLDTSDPDRRLQIPTLRQPVLNSLEQPRRPQFANGNDSRTYLVAHPTTPFAVVVGHHEQETKGASVFEVWVNGFEQPRGLSALAKTLSTDMRCSDRQWLKLKLDSLAKTPGQEFAFPFPPGGENRRVASTVAALAQIIRHRCEELGEFAADQGPHPMVDAMISLREPKSGTNGTLSWTVDIRNDTTGDDFVLFLKEVELSDGMRWPISVWLSGTYPETFDGLCKTLSLDMRIADPAWIAKKLRGLTVVSEPRGDFMARVPGADRQQSYPSTIAYLAELLLHRYRMLGLLDQDSQPAKSEALFSRPGDALAPVAGSYVPGKLCGTCGVKAVIRSDGCERCSNCGELGACG